MRAVFDDDALVRRWLDVEVALARAQAGLGLIPGDAAAAIATQASVYEPDLEQLSRGIAETGHPLMPFIEDFARTCPDGSGEYVHWGATTQDIMDTAVVLQLREALGLIEPALELVTGMLRGLALEHRATPMAGRTHGQHALPITLGFKLAVVIDELERHRDRLRDLRPRLLVVQFAGAAGTLASLGADGRAVTEALAGELELGVPTIAWHSARDGFTELVCVAAMVGATCAKLASEVILLQKTEVAELAEPNTEQSVGSSTMPQKRNPMLSEGIVAAGKLLAQQPSLAVGAMVHQHERDMSAWQAEWKFLPDTAILLAGALELTRQVVEGLSVDPAAMLRNLALTDGLINAEAVMMAIAPTVGRQRAHTVVGAASRRSFDEGLPFLDCLLEEPEIAAALDRAAAEALLQPTAYLGEAEAAVDRVLAGPS
jgi:3-carboxy-cis,cis-muconate cycloisomerase